MIDGVDRAATITPSPPRAHGSPIPLTQSPSPPPPCGPGRSATPATPPSSGTCPPPPRPHALAPPHAHPLRPPLPPASPVPQADQRFKEIANAYEILSDATKRAQYDAGRFGDGGFQGFQQSPEVCAL